MKEIWKSIKNYEGHYMVSNFGRVKSLKQQKRILIPGYNRNYYQVHLCKNSKTPLFEVARLVAEAFIPNPENKPQVNHIDGVKINNYATNLEWCTRSENMLHAYRIGLMSAKGSKNGQSKLIESDVSNIRTLYNSGKYLQREIAEMYNVTRGCVGHIILKTRWQ